TNWDCASNIGYPVKKDSHANNFGPTDSTKPGRPRLVLLRHQISGKKLAVAIFPTQSGVFLPSTA
ncbi:hypothetical protein, partial [Pseudomonas protegens]|uniref:hypothetical protein n=1 Tax=Pseudomonas protegens TaxID=380021 RepID=UPI001B33EFBE